MRERSPTFSILIPTYNQADYLAKALDSILAQTEPDWEAIVVDDGSTDHTRQMLEGYTIRDSRIRSFHKNNGGTATALNKAIEESKGEWICWLSSDDLFEPDKLALHREWIGRCPEARFFFTYFKLLTEATGFLDERHDLWGALPDRSYQTLGLLRRNFISGITICIHRSVFEELGAFDESLRYGQDYDRWLWVTSRYPGVFIPAWTVVNRNHSGQGSEVFPQACYFDTAKAGIRFLRMQTFPKLLPLLDLHRVEVALNALGAGLEIAADPDAFLYWMGFHPALLFCIYDWIAGSGDVWDDSVKEALWNHLEVFAAKEATRHSGAFGCIWRHALVTSRLRPSSILRHGITPEVVGRSFFHHLRNVRPDQVDSLVRYFRQFMNGEELSSSTPDLSGRDVAVTLPFEGSIDARKTGLVAARLLSAAGASVTLVQPGQAAVEYRDGVLVVSVPNSATFERCFRGIRNFDLNFKIEEAPTLPSGVVIAIDISELFSEEKGIVSFRNNLLSRFVPPPDIVPAESVPASINRNLTKLLSPGFTSKLLRKGWYLLKEACSRFRGESRKWVRAKTIQLCAFAVARLSENNEAFEAFKHHKYFLLREHFYLPLPDDEDLTEKFLESKSQMCGIEMDEASMIGLARETLAPYNHEFRAFPIKPPNPGYPRFYLINGGYMAVDGNLYYGLVRYLKPARIIETGCGMSSLLCSEALHRNEMEGYRTKYTCIEPYPQPYLAQNPHLKVSAFITSKMQTIDLEIFSELDENDILFIDTTHALRMGGDVQYIFCEILPRLRSGVYVHIHDISLPKQYPRIYHEEYRYYWNEQYVLQAYLTHNAKSQVIWAGNWLRLRDENRFEKIFPEFVTMREHYPQSEPSAFWFRTK